MCWMRPSSDALEGLPRRCSDRWKQPPVPLANPRSLINMPRIIRKARTIKPQCMCPAFGSLRVGLRMKRVATVLSGSACCVYGLTFVSHFYGARRSVGYVPFNSETSGDRQTVRGHPRERA